MRRKHDRTFVADAGDYLPNKSPRQLAFVCKEVLKHVDSGGSFEDASRSLSSFNWDQFIKARRSFAANPNGKTAAVMRATCPRVAKYCEEWAARQVSNPAQDDTGRRSFGERVLELVSFYRLHGRAPGRESVAETALTTWANALSTKIRTTKDDQDLALALEAKRVHDLVKSPYEPERVLGFKALDRLALMAQGDMTTRPGDSEPKAGSLMLGEGVRLKRAGHPLDEIASILGVSISTVGAMLRGIPSGFVRPKAELVSNAIDGGGPEADEVQAGERYFDERLRAFDLDFAAGMDMASACNRRNQVADTLVTSHDPEKLKGAVRWMEKYLNVAHGDLVMRIEARESNRCSVDELERYWADAMGIPLQRLGKTQILKPGGRRPCDDRRATFGALEVRIRKRKQTNLVLGMYSAKRRHRERLSLLGERTSTSDLFKMANGMPGRKRPKQVISRTIASDQLASA